MKTPFGTEVHLGPGHIVLDGDTAPHLRKGHCMQPQSFRPCLLSLISVTADHLLRILSVNLLFNKTFACIDYTGSCQAFLRSAEQHHEYETEDDEREISCCMSCVLDTLNIHLRNVTKCDVHMSAYVLF